jgi:hypothetical protein
MLELYIDSRGVRRLETVRVFTDFVVSKGLIDSHALFSPSKRDSPLKFEPAADQILKGADHEANTDDELDLFSRSFAINLRYCDVVFSQQVRRSFL